MSTAELPPCGLYRTLRPVAGVPAGRLVFFHNHGNPGPGLYLPVGWKNNRARFADEGHVLAGPEDVEALEPLVPEGFYRVLEPFHCCDRRCRRFEAEALVQLGYDGAATPIVFVPELIEGALAIAQRGTPIDRERLQKLSRLRVPKGKAAPSADSLH